MWRTTACEVISSSELMQSIILFTINHLQNHASHVCHFSSFSKESCQNTFELVLYHQFKLEARFVLRPGHHVKNMEENTTYRSLQCNSLGQILKNKGIPHSNKQKRRTSKPLWERWSLKFTPIDQNDISRHLLEDGQSKVKRTRIHGTVPSWTGREICELWHLCV